MLLSGDENREKNIPGGSGAAASDNAAGQRETGNPAGVLFLITRNDAISFRPCQEIDPDFAAVLKEARNSGIEVLVYGCKVKRKFIRPAGRIEQVW